jgi:predicted amidohydrolase
MADKLKIAIIQTDIIWEKPSLNLKEYTKRINAISKKSDIVLLPEMFNTGFSMNTKRTAEEMTGETIDWMKTTALKHSISIAGTLAIKEGKNTYNRFVWASPNQSIKHYDKRHGFSFAGENKVFKNGDEQVIIKHKGWRIYPQICYDLRFPVWSRNTMNYDAVIYLANWPDVRINAWDALLKARAIENLAFSIGVNIVGSDPNKNHYVGHSSVFDPYGKKISKDLKGKKGILYVELDKEKISKARQVLRFLKDRDEFVLKL